MSRRHPTSSPADPAASVVDRYRDSVGGSGRRHEESTMASFRRRLVVTDILAVAVSLGVGLAVSSRQSSWLIDPWLAIYGTPIAIGVLWMSLLLLRGSYDQRIIGQGSEEIKRVLSATLYTFAFVAGVSYLIRADISRAYAFVALPLGLALIVTGRFSWRRWLSAKRRAGKFLTRTLVIGTPEAGAKLSSKLTQDSHAGFEVVGIVGLPGPSPWELLQWLETVDQNLAIHEARAVAIDPGDKDPHDAVRQLAWRLEGRGIDLLISPGMVDVAGPRLSVRPASGLPLLHLDEAALSRSQRFSKRFLDLIGASLGVILLSPIMLACAVAVRVSSPGPVIFKQQRIGLAGRSFNIFKFRSMRQGADEEREDLRRREGKDVPTFKLQSDPRVTRVGRFIRRWSLDELPQLFNVLGGSMSLVGPRPHPLDDVERYGSEAFRRLALKPGMTGLWQVEGRSDLEWDQALQLDLYYVERWSLATDLVLLARTMGVVVRGRGAV